MDDSRQSMQTGRGNVHDVPGAPGPGPAASGPNGTVAPKRPAAPLDPAARMRELIARGVVVCPDSHQRLVLAEDGARLRTLDGSREYPMSAGVPILTREDPTSSPDLLGVERKFEGKSSARRPSTLRGKLERYATRAFRTPEARVAFDRLFADRSPSRLIVSLGGGPLRVHDTLNVNVALLQNVDLVGDAQRLPFADGVVDGFLCDAVLEHLADPVRAVAEMRRALRPGGLVFACTPFLQNYHGYPHHYQNFTHTGHAHLFESAGFAVEQSGVGNGPMYTMLTLNALFIRSYFPRWCSRWLSNLFRYATAPLRKLDRELGRHPKAYLLASTTFVLAVKR